MSFKYQKWIIRADIRNNPTVLYVFGDNMLRVGYGGQAKEMRGEPNAVGIPTKWSPTRYFSNKDFDKVLPRINSAFHYLNDHLKSGGTVIWPTDGIGSGLADLQQKAPIIWNYIKGQEFKLRKYI